MKKNILLLLGVFCVGLVGNVYADALKKQDVVVTRSNLYAKGRIVFWHNMNALTEVIPANTQVAIVESEGKKIVFLRIDNTKQYILEANASQWDKYFVKDVKEIGVIKSVLAVGMTKKEVYASMGCPAYIAYGVKSYVHSLTEIMQSDTWYYMQNKRQHGKLVKFEKDIAVSVENY